MLARILWNREEARLDACRIARRRTMMEQPRVAFLERGSGVGPIPLSLEHLMT